MTNEDLIHSLLDDEISEEIQAKLMELFTVEQLQLLKCIVSPALMENLADIEL